MPAFGSSRNRRLVFGTILSLLTVVGTLAFARLADAGSGTGPDVTVIRLDNIQNYGVSANIQGYAVGTTSCNTGTAPIWWCNDAGDTFCETNQHPVIAQNMYRLKEGRFEQIGMSWLKHGFLSTNSFEAACGSCQIPTHGGDQLGIGCTDTYDAGLNGNRPLGMRSEVNGTSGAFPYPYTSVGTSNVTDQRVRVPRSEIDPALNAGARYWVEGHYIAADDAAAGNAFNNASYREVSVSAGTFNLNFLSSTVREKSAIEVWPLVDPTVELFNADVPVAVVERFHIARKVTEIGGLFHYEIAVHNMNSDRAARRFVVQFPGAVNITNVGFGDVDHHSGEPYLTTDWTASTGSVANGVEWSTLTFDENVNANALRWGTTFSFWFDADLPPTGSVLTLGLFKPGSPTEISIGSLPPPLFADSFETGDMNAWSSVSPP